MAVDQKRLQQLGLVLIGRNEGERLRLCLESIPADVGGVVYVDSGSSDGSVELAESRGVSVVKLDMSTPFTAARARNEGFAHLMREHASLEYVQFVDGDCSLVEGWLSEALAKLDAHADWLAVCGWRRERHPEGSIYNRWCDLEWTQVPLGDVGDVGFGGDVMMRVDALRAVGGYDGSIIAAEDSELSARMVQSGGRVVRVDSAMTRHDADIHSIRQWWTRCVRSGHAYAEVSSRHAETGLFRRHVRSLVLWGAVLPGMALLSLLVFPVGLLAILGVYGLQIARIASSLDPERFPLADRLFWGLGCLIWQVPKMQGLIQYQRGLRTGVQQRIIEYK